MSTRDFSASGEFSLPERNVDDDAPLNMRAEWIGQVFYRATSSLSGSPTVKQVYDTINSALGIPDPAVDPNGGLQKRATTHLNSVHWIRFYDLVVLFWKIFKAEGEEGDYRDGVNKLLGSYGIVWELSADGKLERVLPVTVAQELSAAVQELQQPDYEPAAELMAHARDAFNDVPRRGRDAAANAFDAMEAAAKVRMGMPSATFGAALDAARDKKLVDTFIYDVLKKVEVVRHNHLGHGMTTTFALSNHEVDLIYVTSALGARLFAGLP